MSTSPNRAVIYARYSSHGQNDASIEQQVAECRAYAEQAGYTILDVYADRALTGTSDKRPDFQRMIADAAKKQFAFVIVWKLDRFARNRYDSAHYKAILRRSGVRVISAKEQISDSPEGIILEGMLEAMAEYYSANLSQNVVRGMKDNAARGRFNGGRVPWGYRAVDHKLVADQLVAPHVRWAFAQYAAGTGKKDIAAELNRRGLRTACGKPFTVNSLSTIFVNPCYVGKYTFDGVESEGVSDRIVDDDTFARAGLRLEQHRRAPAVNRAPERYILQGRAFCGLCGAPMVGESGRSVSGAVYRYYSCACRKKARGCVKRNEPKDEAERYVVERTLRFVCDPVRAREAARGVVALYNSDYAASGIAEAEKRVDRIDREIRDAVDALLGLPKSARQPVLDRLQLLDYERDEADARLRELKAASRVRLDEDDVYAWIMSFLDGDPNDPDYCQRLIDVFVNAVYFYDDRVALLYNGQKDQPPERVTLAELGDWCSDMDGYGPPYTDLSELVRPIFVRDVFGFVFARPRKTPATR